MRYSCSIQKNITELAVLVIAAVLLLTGCAAGKTKSLPFSSPVQNIVVLPDGLKEKKIAVFIMHMGTPVEGGHHEGLMQVKQPWIFGLSREQKGILFRNAGEAASLSFAAELQRQGLRIIYMKEWDDRIIKGSDLFVSGKIEKIVLNTFGRGTVEGFGSAGNYWEATVSLSGLKVEDPSSGETLFNGNMTTYSKLQPCPVKLDWTMLTLVNKSLKGALQLQEMQEAKTVLDTASKGRAYAENWKADYDLEGWQTTPVEVAARKAAVELLSKLKDAAR